MRRPVTAILEISASPPTNNPTSHGAEQSASSTAKDISTSENGTIIIVCSQCPHGTVMLGAYETSATLKKAGAVSGYDITTEAAVAKLYYLFSSGLSGEEIRRRMEQNLRGEISV